MKLWLGNIAPDTNDEEIKGLVRKYAPELTCLSITREEGTGTRPGAILELTGGTIAVADALSTRLSGMYWKGRELTCTRVPGV